MLRTAAQKVYWERILTKYGFRHRENPICALILVLMLFLPLIGCKITDSYVSVEAGTSETAVITAGETENAAPPESGSETGGTEENTDAAEERTEETTAETVVEPADEEDFLNAYQKYYKILRESRGGFGPVSTGAQAALCDICGNGLPELLYLTAENTADPGASPAGNSGSPESSADASEILHIVSPYGEEVSDIFSLKLPPDPEEGHSWCFFTIADDRRMYEYSADPEDAEKKYWYYYEPISDRSLQRTELLMQHLSAGDDPLFGGTFFYMGTECTRESGQEVVRSLLSGMENVLLYRGDRLKEEGFFSLSASAEEYGMSRDQAAEFLRSEIRMLGGTQGLSEDLMYYLEGSEYLESGPEYYTGDGASEIRFGLHDMNGDGAPELLITNGSAALSARTAHVYEPENGSFRYLGDAGFRECLFYTAPGTECPGVFCTGGDSGFIMDIYYELQEDGTIRSEMVASYEDTSYKVESHDEQRVTQDMQLYETWLNACPKEDRPGSFVLMMTREEIMEQGAEALLGGTGESGK